MKKHIILSVPPLLLVLMFQAFSPPPQPAGSTVILNVSDYKVYVGNQVDDRATVDSAFNALLSQTQPATLVFDEVRNYRIRRAANLATSTNYDVVFKMDGKQNLTIDGQGSKLIFEPYDIPFVLDNNNNISIKNLKITFSQSHFSQGTIVNLSSTYLDISLDAGYPLPPPPPIFPDPEFEYGNSAAFNDLGTYLRNVNIFIKSAEVLPPPPPPAIAAPTIVRVYADDKYLAQLSKLQLNYKFAFGVYDKSKRTFDLNKNTNVTLQNIEIYRGAGGGILATENEENLAFDNIKIRREPGSKDLMVFRTDGFHIFYNRASVKIQNCYVERILDDGINIASMAEVATRIHANNKFDLRSATGGGLSPKLRIGDTISAFNLGEGSTKYFLGTAKITSVVDITARIRTITLDKALLGVVALADPADNSGGKRLTDPAATRFFVDEIANPGYIITNNEIRDKPRNGILAKGAHGLIRANKFINIGGSGVDATNNVQFNEGPSPSDLEISGNTFDGVAVNGVNIGLSSPATIKGSTVVSDSSVFNNSFLNLDFLAVKAMNISGLNFSGNTFPTTHPNPLVTLNSTNITYNPVSELFKITGDSGIYFSSGLEYCKYGTMNSLSAAWGPNYASYMTEAKHLPNARTYTYTGICAANESIFFVGSTAIYRGEHDGSFCSFGSMKNLLNLTGITNTTNLKRLPALPPSPLPTTNCRL